MHSKENNLANFKKETVGLINYQTSDACPVQKLHTIVKSSKAKVKGHLAAIKVHERLQRSSKLPDGYQKSKTQGQSCLLRKNETSAINGCSC